MKHFSLCSLFFLLFISVAQAERISCKVTKVIDGDSIRCLIEHTEYKESLDIRLYQIAAPRLGQDYGQESQQALSGMILGRYVFIDTQKKDGNKRTLGTVFLGVAATCQNPRGRFSNRDSRQCISLTDINLKMIQQGYAWYSPFTIQNDDYQQAEQEAKQAKVGLWAQPNPIPPWQWQKK